LFLRDIRNIVDIFFKLIFVLLFWGELWKIVCEINTNLDGLILDYLGYYWS